MLNRLPSSSNQDHKSPYKLSQSPPDYSFLRVFGCQCFPCLRSYSSHKFSPRSLECIFLGYNSTRKGFKCLHLSSGRCYFSRHVLFNEHSFPFSKTKQSHSTSVTSHSDLIPINTPSTSTFDQYVPTATLSPSLSSQSAISTSPNPSSPHPSPNYSSTSSHSSSSSPTSSQLTFSSSHCFASPSILPLPLQPSTISIVHINTHPMVTRAKSGIGKPNPKYALISEVSTITAQSVKESLSNIGWLNAMQGELQALDLNNSWTLMPRTS